MSGHYLQSLLGERENIVMATRHHWFVLASSIFLETVLVFIILVATIGISIYTFDKTPFWWILVIIGFLIMLIPIITGTRDILNWTNHQFIITNHRVMQISGIFNKSVIDSSLDKVNDIKMDQSALGRLFGYGNIEILTASELGVNLFKKIDDPVKFKSALINAKEYLEHAPAEEPKEIKLEESKPDIPDLINRLADLRSRGVITEAEFLQKKSELLSKI